MWDMNRNSQQGENGIDGCGLPKKDPATSQPSENPATSQPSENGIDGCCNNSFSSIPMGGQWTPPTCHLFEG